MIPASYADACRQRTRELLKITEGIYDHGERLALECMVREFEELAIEAGPLSPEAADRRGVPGGGGRSAARKAAQTSNRQF
jgi:hypothetical protein